MLVFQNPAIPVDLFQGPCYGELGTGEKFRTQGVPKKNKEFQYANILKVNMFTISKI